MLALRRAARLTTVVGCSALIAAVTTTSAGAADATGSAAFHLHPTFGAVGTTLRLTDGDFTGDTGVTVNGVAADDFTMVNSHEVTAVVPAGASTGPVAVTDGVTTTTGPTFVLQQATAGGSSLSKSKLTFGHGVVAKAHEDVAGTGTPVVGANAVLQHRAAGSSAWHNAKGTHVKQTGQGGRVQWSVKPHANGSYRIHFRQSHTYAGLTTTAGSVHVSPRLHLKSLHTVSELATTEIQGSVHPHLAGKVYLQQHRNGSWHPVKHTAVQDGHFSFAISPSSLSRLTYRVVRRADSTHAHATSRTLHLEVVHRTLSLGDSGQDVLALQKRLHHLHYDIGPRNGDYGYDTLHAVTAFEKVNGLSKDGQAGTAVWNALNHPKKVHLRHPYPDASLAVEVNLAKQVLILAKNGKVWRILDTSTAGGYYYTNSEGETEKAVTPTGHFSIQYKLTGWHQSDLGELYYPSYFTDTGYAIHGEGNGNGGDNVPPYPNSHGCVRITNNAVLRYYNLLAVGTSVWIYS